MTNAEKKARDAELRNLANEDGAYYDPLNQLAEVYAYVRNVTKLADKKPYCAKDNPYGNVKSAQVFDDAGARVVVKDMERTNPTVADSNAPKVQYHVGVKSRL